MVDNNLKLRDLKFHQRLGVYETTKKPDQVQTDNGIQIYPNQVYHMSVTPNDTFYSQQYALSKINAPAAWDTTTGSASIVIAVVDTGFGLNHQDLSSKWWTNSGEMGTTSNEGPIPNCTSRGLALDKSCNNLDDDGDGLTDDWRGWDFYDGSNDVSAGKTSPLGSGVSHGTYTASLAAASSNDGKGIAGVCWQCRLMPLQALNDDGQGYTTDIASAIDYAVDRGANVINLSLGSPVGDQILQDAVNYALNHNVTVVAAAGNLQSGQTAPCPLDYPAAYSGVISVGATDSNNQVANFSCTGPTLSLVAPGVNVLSDAWSITNQTTGTATVNGTSISSAIVSGIAGLLKSYRPSASPSEVLTALRTNAYSVTSGSSQYWLPNAQYALDALAAAPGQAQLVWRLYNPYSNDHFYTISLAERDFAIARAGYRLEGPAFIAYSSAGAGLIPVYRSYSPYARYHFYTVDYQEARSASTIGYGIEGIAFFVPQNQQSGTEPVYRIYYPQGGKHFYTASSYEAGVIKSWGWKIEGVAWYAF